jgi:hypothetical protein
MVTSCCWCGICSTTTGLIKPTSSMGVKIEWGRTGHQSLEDYSPTWQLFLPTGRNSHQLLVVPRILGSCFWMMVTVHCPSGRNVCCLDGLSSESINFSWKQRIQMNEHLDNDGLYPSCSHGFFHLCNPGLKVCKKIYPPYDQEQIAKKKKKV